MGVASIRLVLGFWFIVTLLVFGNVPALGAEDTQSLEGEWAITSSKYDWDRITIVRQDGGYNVKSNTKGQPNLWEGFYQGNATEIITSRNIPSENFAADYPAPVIRALKDKITFRYKFTLSGDGRSVEFARDNLGVHYYQNTGELYDHFIAPFAVKTTFVRVAKSPPPVIHTAVSEPINAAVVARGEFYIITKDGRKLTGKDVNQVPCEDGAKVVTGSSGRVQLLLPDETVFTIGANSEIEIDKFVYDTDRSPKTIIANVSKGIFRWVTGKTKPPKDPAEMKVTMPVVAVGIRGTDFEVTVNPDGSGMVILQFGQLEVTEKKSGFTFILDAGYKVTFNADGSVSRPIKAD